MAPIKFPFANTVSRGLGQIMLQENAATGLLFLVGIFYGSISMGIAAILSASCGTITARLLAFDRPETQKGLYGFSPALVGVALILFFEPVFVVWLFVIIGAVAAALLQHWFIKNKIPVFTLPFILVTWVIIYFFQILYPIAPAVVLSPEFSSNLGFTFAFRGFGQVIFQGSVFAGAVFFLGVFIHSPMSALYGLAGSGLAGVLALWFSAPVEAVGLGLFSYNAVLCAIAFSGNGAKDGVWALISVIVSVIFSVAMYRYELIQLTFPFVAATCICLAVKNIAIPAFGRHNF